MAHTNENSVSNGKCDVPPLKPAADAEAGAVQVPVAGTKDAAAESSAAAEPSTCARWCAYTEAMCLKHFLVLGLLLAIVVGTAAPALGSSVASWQICGALGCVGGVQTIYVVCIFVISGLTLKTDEVKKALRAWPDGLYGVIAILFITPLLALLPGQLSFLPPEFQVGFLLFCSMPTTINAGVALVTAGKGNVAMALLLTLASNLIGVVTVPFYLGLLLGVSGIKIDPGPLLLKLLLMIMLPLAVGKVIRDLSPRVQAKTKAHKMLLSNTSSLLLCFIPWMALSTSSTSLRELSWQNVLGLLGCGLLIHAIYLVFNYFVAHCVLGTELSSKKALVIMGSQKTLPMAMTVLAFFPPSLGTPGLIALPCIVSHLIQIFVDAFIMAKWADAKETAPPRSLFRDRGRFRCTAAFQRGGSEGMGTSLAPAGERSGSAPPHEPRPLPLTC